MNNETIYNMMKSLIGAKYYETKEEANVILAMYLGMQVLEPEQVTELTLFVKSVYEPEKVADSEMDSEETSENKS